MTDLFSEDPQFRRAQYSKISDNVQAWPQEIAALVAEHLPAGMGLDVSTVFQKVDPKKGYAIGTAVVRHPNTPKQVGIPIIVKAWHVAPFDMFFQDNKLSPLTEDALARAFFSSNVGAGLASPKPPPQMLDDTFENRFPPLGAKYASVAEAIAPTRAPDDVALLHAAVRATPAALAKFAKNGTFAKLQKWASEVAPAERTFDLGRTKAMTVKKVAPDRYRVLATAEDAFDPVLVSVDRQGLRQLFDVRRSDWAAGQDPMRDLDRNGEVTLQEKPERAGQQRQPFLFNPLQDDRTVLQADRFGRYGVTDKSGILAKGWLLPRVVTFDGKKTALRIFVGPALAAIQHRIAGIRLGDESIALPTGDPETGQMGTLVHIEGGDCLATVPFTVVGVTVYGGQRSIAIVDEAGTRMNLIPSAGVRGIVPLNASERLGPLGGPGKNYLVPATMAFVRFGKVTSVSEGADAFRKVATDAALDVAPLKVSVANGRYVFRGSAITKYARAGVLGGARAVVTKGRNLASQVALASADAAKRVKATVEKAAFDTNALARHEAAFLLSAWGLGHDKVAAVLDGAQRHVVLEVHHLRYPAPASEKTASPSSEAWVRKYKPAMAELVKAAAMLEDADAVDTVLSLGFINRDNIQRFAAIRPMLEEVTGLLAKLLLGARLGMEDIPEEAARSAILSLQQVIDGLSQLQMLARQEKTSGEARARGAA